MCVLQKATLTQKKPSILYTASVCAGCGSFTAHAPTVAVVPVRFLQFSIGGFRTVWAVFPSNNISFNGFRTLGPTRIAFDALDHVFTIILSPQRSLCCGGRPVPVSQGLFCTFVL